MPDFTTHRHPVLAVPCPTCGRPPGVWCQNEAGGVTINLHLARVTEADCAFMAQHGASATVSRIADGWQIDPHGRDRD